MCKTRSPSNLFYSLLRKKPIKECLVGFSSSMANDGQFLEELLDLGS